MMKHTKKEIAIFIQNKDPSLELVKPKQTARSSPFWSSFQQVFYKRAKQDLIRCNDCGSILTHRSIDGTKVMSTHIKACKKKDKPDADQQHADIFLSASHRTSPRISSKLKKSITDACVELATLDNRPFEIVKGAGFHNLMGSMFLAGQQLSQSSGTQASDLIPDSTTVIG